MTETGEMKADVVMIETPLGGTRKTCTAELLTDSQEFKTNEVGVKTQDYEGLELIVPCAITMEGVQNQALKAKEEIIAALALADGRYVCTGNNHPEGFVVTKRQDVRGFMRNLRLRNIKVDVNAQKVELVQMLSDLHVRKGWTPKGEYNNIKSGKSKSVSIGYWCVDTPTDKPQIFLNQSYRSKETNILIDHTLIINPEGEPAACPYRTDGLGCGMLNTQREAGPGPAIKEDNSVPSNLADAPSDDGQTVPASDIQEAKRDCENCPCHKQAERGDEQGSAQDTEQNQGAREKNVMEETSMADEEIKEPDKAKADAQKKADTQVQAPLPKPDAAQDAQLAKEVARANVAEVQLKAYQDAEKSRIIGNIMKLTGRDAKDDKSIASFNAMSLPELKVHERTITDAVAAARANLLHGASAAMGNQSDTSSKPLVNTKTGLTVGRFNQESGKWEDGWDAPPKEA